MSITNKEKAKKQKKLVLNKETLKDLTVRGAGKVMGGQNATGRCHTAGGSCDGAACI